MDKTLEQRLEELEKEVKNLPDIIENLEKIFHAQLAQILNMLGIRIIESKDNTISYQILIPRKEDGGQGIVSRLYTEVAHIKNKLKSQDENRIITPNGSFPKGVIK